MRDLRIVSELHPVAVEGHLTTLHQALLQQSRSSYRLFLYLLCKSHVEAGRPASSAKKTGGIVHQRNRRRKIHRYTSPREKIPKISRISRQTPACPGQAAQEQIPCHPPAPRFGAIASTQNIVFGRVTIHNIYAFTSAVSNDYVSFFKDFFILARIEEEFGPPRTARQAGGPGGQRRPYRAAAETLSPRNSQTKRRRVRIVLQRSNGSPERDGLAATAFRQGGGL